MENDVNLSSILNETVTIAKDAVRLVALFVIVIGGINAAGLYFGLIDANQQTFGISMGVMVDGNSGLLAAAYQLLAAAITIVGSYFLIAHYLDLRDRLPERATRIWAYVGLSILSVLGMVLGFLLLIVPGIILLVRWSAASGYLIGGREGVIDAMSASWHATDGHGWSIFGAGVIMLICLFIFGAIIGATAFVATTDMGIAIAASFADAVGSAVGMAFGTAVYCLVADNTDTTAEVFE